MNELSSVLLWTIRVCMALFTAAFLGVMWRVVRGPSLPDRVVAIDLASYVTMGFLGAYAVLADQPAYLDAALVLGLLSFLGTIAFARYIEQRRASVRKRQEPTEESGA
ncbi:MAG: pesticidal protein Cry22Aa [Bacteroidetes bacterium QS_8_64_10]|jgi:multicomponent Na+:H+ antiporter subunit F|nr:MAG: pesticidal protein Cry22Aa [Bacteroidetes bacterium QS_8_64_10]